VEVVAQVEAGVQTMRMLQLQGQLVVQFATRYSLLAINDPLLLKAGVTALGWVLSNCTGETYKAAVEALLSAFSFSDELVTLKERPLLQLGAPDPTSVTGSASWSDARGAGEEDGEEDGDEGEEASYEGFMDPEELASVLDLEDVNLKALLLAELRRLCESSSEAFSNVGMIVLMTFATHPRFLALEACQLSALLHLLRNAALQVRTLPRPVL
jgi:hypothetical protein